MDVLRIIIYWERINLSLNQNIGYTRVIFLQGIVSIEENEFNLYTCILQRSHSSLFFIFNEVIYMKSEDINNSVHITRLDNNKDNNLIQITWIDINIIFKISFQGAMPLLTKNILLTNNRNILCISWITYCHLIDFRYFLNAF